MSLNCPRLRLAGFAPFSANRGGSVPSSSGCSSTCAGRAAPSTFISVLDELPGGGTGIVMASSVQPDSGIQEGVQNIDYRAQRHITQHTEYHDRHYHRIVVLHNRLVKQEAEPMI